MKRRSFLAAVVGAMVAPSLPLPVSAAPAVAPLADINWHQHSVYDPGHAHSVLSDEELERLSHEHGIRDPGHTHGIWIYQ